MKGPSEQYAEENIQAQPEVGETCIMTELNEFYYLQYIARMINWSGVRCVKYQWNVYTITLCTLFVPTFLAW